MQLDTGPGSYYDILEFLRRNKNVKDEFQLMLRVLHMIWVTLPIYDFEKLPIFKANKNIYRVAVIRAEDSVPSDHEYAAALVEWKQLLKDLNWTKDS